MLRQQDDFILHQICPFFSPFHFIFNVFSSVSYVISDLWADELLFLNKKPLSTCITFQINFDNKTVLQQYILGRVRRIQELKILNSIFGFRSGQNVQLNDMSVVPLIKKLLTGCVACKLTAFRQCPIVLCNIWKAGSVELEKRVQISIWKYWHGFCFWYFYLLKNNILRVFTWNSSVNF